MNDHTINAREIKAIRDYAEELISNGFTEVFPLPANSKCPPPTGITGRSAPHRTREEVLKGLDGLTKNSNLGFRIPKGCIGIDIDHGYRSKEGWTHFEKFLNSRGVSIAPEKWQNEYVRQTRRGVDSPAAHFYFRLPEGYEDMEFKSDPCTDVELLQHHHRYAVTSPSVIDGEMYRWYKGNDETGTPLKDRLPILPLEIAAALVEGPRRGSREKGDPESLRASLAWLQGRVFAGESRAELPADVDRYDTMVSTIMSLISNAVHNGHAGLLTDLERIRAMREGYELAEGRTVSDDYAGAVTSAVAIVKAEIASGLMPDINWRERFGAEPFPEDYALPNFSDLVANAAAEAEPREVVELTDEELADLADLADFEDYLSAAHREKQAKKKTKKKGLQMHSFEDIETKEPSWLWEYDEVGGIPIGAMTVFTGKGEVGKSTACRWMAARVTHGTLPGHWHGTPKSVLYIAAEESNESMVKPSLLAHGADMARMKWISVDEEANMLSPDDMGDLMDLCLASDVALVVVDPMSNFMHGANMNNSSEVRERMRPWTRLAEAIDGSVIAIFHQNKSGSGDVVYGIGGAAAISEVSRSVFGFARDIETDECVMSQEKNNLGQRMPSLSYRLESVKISGWKKSLGKFDIVGPSDFSAGEVQMRNKQVSSGEKETAQSWLKAYLRENGPTLKNVIVKDSTYSLNSLEKASQALKLKRETQDRAAVWSLP